MGKMSKEHRKKISEAQKRFWNNKTYEEKMELLKYVHNEKTRKKISKSCKGRKAWNKGMTGFSHTQETREKMSKIAKANWDNMSKNKRNKWITNVVNAHCPSTDTKIELKVEEDLKLYNIKYIKQKTISNGKRNFVLDFYIPSLKLVIECNGDYWHKLPERKQRDKELKEYVESTGRKIIFIWEHEIKDDWFDILDYILLE